MCDQMYKCYLFECAKILQMAHGKCNMRVEIVYFLIAINQNMIYVNPLYEYKKIFRIPNIVLGFL